MANKNLFNTLFNKNNSADARNQAGGLAYQLSDKQALAQLAATGCLNQTFYATGADQLQEILRLSENVSAEFIAKTVIYARQTGLMKDMPALLLAVLAQKDAAMCARVFNQVIDNGKMLRNFVQILRSGTIGRQSLGTRPKKLVQQTMVAECQRKTVTECSDWQRAIVGGRSENGSPKTD